MNADSTDHTDLPSPADEPFDPWEAEFRLDFRTYRHQSETEHRPSGENNAEPAGSKKTSER